MATADLVIRIVTDTSKAKGLDETSGKFSKVGAGLKKMAAPAGLALAGIVAFGAGAVKAASDVQQSLGAVDAVFGKNATQIKKWADTSATAVGLSKNAYMELATVTGAQLKNMGLPMDQVTGKTNDLIKKGADLAAQFGGTTKDAVEAIGSALRGETDPIERYGISIKQADIAAQQAAEGTDKLTGAAGKQAKTMALLHLLNKQSADSTGAFAREQDSAAHQAQVAQAQYADLQAELGQALLPVVTDVAKVLGQLAKFMAKHSTATKVAIGVVAGLAAAVLALNLAMTVYTAVTTLAASATLAAWMAALGPILLIIAAIAAVVAIVIILWKKFPPFKAAVMATWAAIQAGARLVWAAIQKIGNVAARVFGWIRSHWRLLAAILGGPFVAATILIIAKWDRIKQKIKAVLDWMKSAVRGAVNVITAVWDKIRNKSAAVWDAVRTKIRNVVTAVKGIVEEIWTKARDVFIKVAGGWTGLVGKLKLPAGLADTLKAPFTAMKDAVTAVGSAIADLVRKIAGIHFPKPPSWLHKVMPGMAMAPAAPVPAGLGVAPAVAMPRAGGASGGAGGLVVNIYGAVDPEGTARQVQRILGGHNRRVGLRVS